MKTGWEIKELGEVLQKTETTNPLLRPEEEFEYIDVSSVSNVTFQIEETQHLTGKDAPSRARKQVKTNDVLFATIRPTLRRIAVVPEHLDKQVCSTGYFVLRPKVGIDHRYLFYWLFSEDFMGQMEILQKGASYPAVTDAEVRAQAIPIPPLLEQQRIVGILDEAFDGIATAKSNVEKNLQNARALFESHLQSVFTQRGEGWVEKPLGVICDLLNGFAFKSGDTVPESETQLVRMGNLYGNKLDLDRSPVFYPDSFATDYKRYILDEGDIIMSLTGTTGKEDYGYAVRIPKCEMALLMNQRIVKFDSIREDAVNRDYLLHYLRSRAFLDVLYPTANGTRQANLSSVTIKTLPIPLCSIQEQKRIALSLESLSDETQHLESIYQQKLAALDALKKSLLDQAFTGQL
jgi:type I restriction enzyme S subunit